jgi:hypothetical protein
LGRYFPMVGPRSSSFVLASGDKTLLEDARFLARKTASLPFQILLHLLVFGFEAFPFFLLLQLDYILPLRK